jgi:hypothetical protein
MKQIIRQGWQNLKNKLLKTFSKVGTHVHIGLTVLVFIFTLINRQQAIQVSKDSARIETATVEIFNYRDSMRIKDQKVKARIDSMHKDFRRLEEITLRNDKSVALVQREIAALRVSKKGAVDGIAVMTDAQLVEYMNSKKLEKKKP